MSEASRGKTKAALPGLLKAHFLTPAGAEVMACAGQLANELGAINGGGGGGAEMTYTLRYSNYSPML